MYRQGAGYIQRVIFRGLETRVLLAEHVEEIIEVAPLQQIDHVEVEIHHGRRGGFVG